MTGRIQILVLQYGAAVLSVGIALVLTYLIWPLVDPASTPIFCAAVMVSAFYGGLGPGLLATVLSTWAIDFFFVPPYRTMELTAGNFARASVFIAVAILISWLNATRKKLTEDLRHKNQERESLLAQISGFNDELRVKIEEATRELSVSNQELLQTQQRLIRSERLAVAGQMAASLAHEVGTPLNAISGHLQLLARDHPQHSDTQRRIQILSNQLDFIIGIVRRLLELTHKRQAPYRPTDLNLLIHETLSLVAPMLEEHEIDLWTDLAAELPPISVDCDGLRQVFLNLINNSLDAMADGGRLEISTRLDLGNQTVELIFRDTGTGIDPSAVEHIFEPMWTTKPAGSGFGLAIAREIVVEHGGQIEVIGEQCQGAAFLVKLPLIEARSALESPGGRLTNVA